MPAKSCLAHAILNFGHMPLDKCFYSLHVPCRVDVGSAFEHDFPIWHCALHDRPIRRQQQRFVFKVSITIPYIFSARCRACDLPLCALWSSAPALIDYCVGNSEVAVNDLHLSDRLLLVILLGIMAVDCRACTSVVRAGCRDAKG
jgi:hypothetical protein